MVRTTTGTPSANGMPMPVRAALLCALLVACGSRADTASEPVVPDGFVRVAFDEIGASFVHPEGWHAALAKAKLMGSLVITAPGGRGDDGTDAAPARFVVNAVPNLMRVRSRRVSEQIEGFDRALASGTDPQRRASATVRRDGYVGRDISLRRIDVDGRAWRERRMYLADDARDWLLIVSLTAPESGWAALSAVREAMFDGFVLGGTIADPDSP